MGIPNIFCHVIETIHRNYSNSSDFLSCDRNYPSKLWEFPTFSVMWSKPSIETIGIPQIFCHVIETIHRNYGNSQHFLSYDRNYPSKLWEFPRFSVMWSKLSIETLGIPNIFFYVIETIHRNYRNSPDFLSCDRNYPSKLWEFPRFSMDFSRFPQRSKVLEIPRFLWKLQEFLRFPKDRKYWNSRNWI